MTHHNLGNIVYWIQQKPCMRWFLILTLQKSEYLTTAYLPEHAPLSIQCTGLSLSSYTLYADNIKQYSLLEIKLIKKKYLFSS